jgi:WD40 repeat protein
VDGCKSLVMAVALDCEGNLFTGGMDGHVRVWDCYTGAGTVAWRAHGDWCRSLAIHGRPDYLLALHMYTAAARARPAFVP